MRQKDNCLLPTPATIVLLCRKPLGMNDVVLRVRRFHRRPKTQDAVIEPEISGRCVRKEIVAIADRNLIQL